MASPSHKPPKKERKGSGAATERVFGLAAARAVIEKRPRDVLHIAHTREARGAVAEILREAAKHRIAYREVERDELARIADSLHHEGICMQVVARRAVSVAELASALRKGGFVVALDGVDNPHNLGALLRTAAYFGASGVLSAGAREVGVTPSAARVAEGGAEHVPVCSVPELGAALDQLRDVDAQIIGADAHRGEPSAQLRWPERTVLVLGSERTGLSAAAKRRCQQFVRIEGTNAVESLNVSVAAGILLASLAQSARSRA